jgi:hypothetical protein
MISFVMSVRPSVRMEQLGFHWKDFHKIWYLRIFSKICRENQTFFKYETNNVRVLYMKGTLHEGYYTWRVLYMKGTIHEGYFTWRVLYMKGTIHEGYYTWRVLYMKDTLHEGYYTWRVLYMKGTLPEVLCKFMISDEFFSEWELFQTSLERKKQNIHSMFNILFSEILPPLMR